MADSQINVRDRAGWIQAGRSAAAAAPAQQCLIAAGPLFSSRPLCAQKHNIKAYRETVYPHPYGVQC